MKPAPFEYMKALTTNEALEYLQQWGDQVKILAGGQSLIPLLNMRLAEPPRVLDINNLKDLTGVRYERESHTVRIGALTRHQQLAKDPVILEHLPMLAEAAKLIGHLAIRTRGTFAGSLVHADPSAELPMMVAMLRGEFECQSLEQHRMVPADDFFLGFYMTDLRPEEMVVSVTVPVPPQASGYAIREFSRRHGDFAVAVAATVLSLDADGTILKALVGVGGLGGRGTACPEVEAALLGVGDSLKFRAAAERLAENIDPADDVQASAEFRRHVGIELLVESMEAAYENAKRATKEVTQ